MEEVELITIKIFYSYACTEKDTPLRNELDKHLANLHRQHIITGWSDQDINAGSERKQEIEKHLQEADIILLLVSPDFMHSDYCYSIELQKALEKHKAKQAEVVPILLRSVDWEGSLFSHLQSLPLNAKPIKTWNDPDEAFLDVVQGIKIVVKRKLVQKHVLKAQEFLSNKQPELSLVYCNKAIEIDIKADEAFNARGDAFNYLGRTEEALASYRIASEIKPNNACYYSSIGNTLHYILGRREEALTAYRRASEIQPSNVFYHANIGNVLNSLGRRADALTAYRRASEIQPNNAGYYSSTGDILNSLGKKEEALTAYRRASEIEPNNAHTYLKIGYVLNSLGKKEEALTAYRRASEIDPNNASYHSNIGDVLYSLGREEALIAYRRASEIKPNNVYCYSRIGDVLYSLGKKEEALTAYRRASEIKPNSARYYDQQGAILEQLAQEMYIKAAELRNTGNNIKK